MSAIRLKPLIYIVEDESLIAQMYSEKFTADGYECKVFSDSKKALQEAKKNIPDLVVTDIILSGLDGLALLETLKSDEHTKSIPVILLSNLGIDEYQKRGVELGASAYIVKSEVLPADVVDHIKNILRQNGKTPIS